MKTTSMLKGMVAGLGLSLLAPAAAWAVPADNPLPTYDRNGSPAILFTNAELEYKPGRTKKRSGGGDTGFTAFTQFKTENSVFTLRNGTTDTVFSDGYLELHATISPKGTFRNGWFVISSTDSMFGFDSNSTVERCKRTGKACATVQGAGVVFGGDLDAFGWSSSQGIIEFSTTNLYGWAHDMLAPDDNNEHIYFNVGAFDLNEATSVHSWMGYGDGVAIIPVPAAVWLFGSGLLGLVGIARRKRA